MRLTALTPSLAGLLALASSAAAMSIAPSPISQRVAKADAVVLGKVAAVAVNVEKAELFKGDVRQMRVATVAVEETLSGKKAKTIRVAFLPPPPAPPPAAGGGLRIIRGGGPGNAQLAKDQEGVFFLTKHPTKKGLFVVQQYFDVVNKAGNPSYATQLEETRKYAKLLKDAKKNLDSKDAAVRSETAMMLVTRYRSAPAGVAKTEPVPGRESKKLLLALAGADWNAKAQMGTATPMNAFYLLGLQPKDGWIPPKDYTQVPAAAKKWLEANAGKYEMRRYVRASDTKDGTEPE